MEFFEKRNLKVSLSRSMIENIKNALKDNLSQSIEFKDNLFVVTYKNDNLVWYVSFRVSKNTLQIDRIYSINSEINDNNKIHWLWTNMVLYLIRQFNPSKVVINNILPQAEWFWEKIINILQKDYPNISWDECSLWEISATTVILEK